MEIRDIPKSQIIIPESYIKSHHPRHLCKAIEAFGYIPIIVTKVGDKYELIDGYGRLQCVDGDTVTAIVVDKNEKTQYWNVVLNYVRGKTCGIDILAYTAQLAAENNVSIASKILGRGYDTIRKYVSAYQDLIQLGIGKDGIQKLRELCVPVRRIIACVNDARNANDFFECLTQVKKKVVKEDPEALRIAKELREKGLTNIKPESIKGIIDFLIDDKIIMRLKQCLGPERYKELIKILADLI